jgi:hypothetical protein
MTMLAAFGHFAGAIVAYLVFGILTGLLHAWNAERVGKKLVAEAGMTLGLTTTQIDDPKNTAVVQRYLAARSSSELLRNRLSDLAGLLQTILYWVCNIASLLILLGVGYATVTDDLQAAVHVWWIMPLNLIVWLIGLLWGFACLLLTGRYPGEAKLARKNLMAHIDQRTTESHNPSEDLNDDLDDDWDEDDGDEQRSR